MDWQIAAVYVTAGLAVLSLVLRVLPLGRPKRPGGSCPGCGKCAAQALGRRQSADAPLVQLAGAPPRRR